LRRSRRVLDASGPGDTARRTTRLPPEVHMQAIILWLLGVPIIAIIALKLFGVF
jgi:hypothetical protein